jgi:AcrR family transcriptional regulator
VTFDRDFDHRDDLLAAALEEFSERGFDAGSVNRILADAGMSKGQLYHHFPDKEALYLGLVRWMIAEKAAWLATHPPTPNDDFFDQVAAHVEASVRFASQRPEVDRFARALLAERGRPIYAAVVAAVGFDADGMLAAWIRTHHEAGAFRADVPLDLIEKVVLLLLNHAPDLLDLSSTDDTTERVHQLLGVLRHGIANPD